MPGSSQDTSFIPKHNANRRKRTARRGNIYVLTIVSYVVFFASLAATAAVFFYERHVTSVLQEEIATMSAEVSSFKEADMQRVLNFDQRLSKAYDRIEASVSVASIFDALESATVGSVRFESFSLERNADRAFVIEADIETNSFDSSLFQRGVFERNQIISAVEVSDLSIADESTESGAVFKSVSFLAKLSVPLSVVPYQPPASAPTLDFFSEPEPQPVEDEGQRFDEAGGPDEEEGATTLNEPPI